MPQVTLISLESVALGCSLEEALSSGPFPGEGERSQRCRALPIWCFTIAGIRMLTVSAQAYGRQSTAGGSGSSGGERDARTAPAWSRTALEAPEPHKNTIPTPDVCLLHGRLHARTCGASSEALPAPRCRHGSQRSPLCLEPRR